MADKKIKEKSSPWRTVGRIAAKFGITVVEILLFAVIAIYCLGHLAANWPSEHVRGWIITQPPPRSSLLCRKRCR